MTRADVRDGSAAARAEAIAGIPDQLRYDHLLGQRYRLTERIATGGMGQVWRGTDELLGRPVAVKLLSARLAADEQFRTRFRAEARYAASLSHPGIARVYDYGESADEPEGTAADPSCCVPYLVMELIEGEPLSAALARDGRMSAEATLDLVAQAARALEAAHAAGIVHRDIKPGNLLLTPDRQVKITDFGIARAVLDARLTQTGMVMGTAQYVSPEQASARPVTAATDIYSLGVVAYECLAGQPPFTVDTPIALAFAHVSKPPPPLPGDVPALAAALVGQMLAKEPSGRPASAGAVAERASALRAALREGTPRQGTPHEGTPGDGADPLILSSARPASPGAWFSDPGPAGHAADERVTTAALAAGTAGRPARSRRQPAAAAAIAALVLAAAVGIIIAIAATRHPAARASTSSAPPRRHASGSSAKAPRSPGLIDQGTPAPRVTSSSSAARPRPSPSPTGSSTASPSPSASPAPTSPPTGSPTPTPSLPIPTPTVSATPPLPPQSGTKTQDG